jgi:hypothetical protein
MGHLGQLTLQCAFRDCQRLFTAYYQVATGNRSHFVLLGTSFGSEKPATTFAEVIKTLSPSFVTIYEQAEIAERRNLLEICGAGYRRAIEFLIKDHSIATNPERKADIEKMPLGHCIKEFVTDLKVKSVASRAVWLGNDETHYVRKWEGKNLEDLKSLIRLTLHWLEMEAETKRFEEEMPHTHS